MERQIRAGAGSSRRQFIGGAVAGGAAALAVGPLKDATASSVRHRGRPLIDPPGWPGGDTWRGRDAVLRRRDEVTEQLRAETVEIRQARSLDGERVLADFVVCRVAGSGGRAGFSAILTLHGDQITAMRAFTDHDQARRAAKLDARVVA